MSFRTRALAVLAIVAAVIPASSLAGDAPPSSWKVGEPIVTYWCGPAMSDAVAGQLAEGGWNLVWCEEKDLDLVARHGLRAQLTHPLLTPESLDRPDDRKALDALVVRVKDHPALHAYHIVDEPAASRFEALGRIVAYLRERDPAHLAYINLFPTYASNEQLGTRGDTVTAYTEHLRLFVETVKPGLLSWDHYQLAVGGDNPEYFLNLALVRKAALAAGLPFLQIVQACTWTPSMRVPVPDEMRYLVHTTLAYGAQGISYYTYSCPGHTGPIVGLDGKPSALYDALKVLNREFAAAAAELAPLRSLGVFHAGMMPPGAEPLPAGSPFLLDPEVGPIPYAPPEPVRGVLLGLFGPPGGSDGIRAATHACAVNLDYKAGAVIGLAGPGPLEAFDPSSRRWVPAGSGRTELRLPPGGGRLVRRAPAASASAEASGSDIILRAGGQELGRYRFGPAEKSPFLYPVAGPRTGESLTTAFAEPYPHHRSVFFGCDRVNGGNYWQEGPERGLIVSSGAKVIEAGGAAAVIEDVCRWEKPGGPAIVEDRRRITLTAPTADLRLLEFDIVLTALADLRVERTNHSLFAVRAAADLAPAGGGVLVSSEGERGEKGTFGKKARWCDFSGDRGGVREGIAILDHPENPWSPCPWFTRDYGFISPTPLQWIPEEGWRIEKGRSVRLRYLVVAHGGDAAEAGLDGIHARWIAGNLGR